LDRRKEHQVDRTTNKTRLKAVVSNSLNEASAAVKQSQNNDGKGQAQFSNGSNAYQLSQPHKGKGYNPYQSSIPVPNMPQPVPKDNPQDTSTAAFEREIA
jgi:hypothetical protein